MMPCRFLATVIRSYVDALMHTLGLLLGWFAPSNWISWKPTSMAQLAQAENKLLQCVKHAITGKFVLLPRSQQRIWTIAVNEDFVRTDKSPTTPIVLVHGFGGGLGLWAQNLNSLGKNAPVYAFDVLGFGHSARPTFSKNATMAEMQFVDSVEEWRKEMKLDSFILVGHSFGGYIASSFAIKHPECVKHLVLVDPWGFPEQPPKHLRRQLPFWIKVSVALMSPFNPLAPIRGAGPLGKSLVRNFRPDLKLRFSDDDDTIFDYIYHCNAQTPSGETAFKNMTMGIGWAKRPMIHRVTDIANHVPITMVYGAKSWMDSNTGNLVKYLRNTSYVDVQVVKGAGHHVYADQPGPFNSLVAQICDMVDRGVLPVKSNSPKYKQRGASRTTSESAPDIDTTKPDKIPSPL
ncbi:protein ABHD4-like [Mizuhopecten yessoensis]|uniref:1-acylglycerol-3-phosphate O-acyltransferase ABHD5 n=1 Tax=Mizuhopecten yessoensis TaxID=6573 RepID=A0A210Q8M9_MIZYE|nr:protein ABHD4-like [Mizuhopecten yessoensis]OWF45088.1 Abhydrolase domain-containing protein 4 [Mizuhopecten yessoensis]